jgi:redox-sensitive bicupin YhaK (pirin superfamily)
MSSRSVVRVIRGRPTSDGAGVRLTRVIGGAELGDFDPFLLLDEFGSDKPGDYIAGFPEHPHRGFETVTYMLAGRMRHKDNHGNEGLLVAGSVQWMTAGRGILHSEMPEQESGLMRGFQLWVNLPARDKMTAPRYQEFAPDKIPVARPVDGVEARVIAGAVGDVIGPVQAIATDPTYLDLALAPGARYVHALPEEHSAFVYPFEGGITVGSGEGARTLAARELGALGPGNSVELVAGDVPARALLIAGRPLREPIAKYGPFVMNTEAEIYQAVADLRAGKF